MLTPINTLFILRFLQIHGVTSVVLHHMTQIETFGLRALSKSVHSILLLVHERVGNFSGEGNTTSFVFVRRRVGVYEKRRQQIKNPKKKLKKRFMNGLMNAGGPA